MKHYAAIDKENIILLYYKRSLKTSLGQDGMSLVMAIDAPQLAKQGRYSSRRRMNREERNNEHAENVSTKTA